MERTVAIPLAGRIATRSPKRLLALRSDDRLVDRVRAGDEAAFEVLYERHIAGVLGYCRHMLGSQAEAEDAVQQAFVSAHSAMRRGSREIVFKPWLYTIARNRCLSILRARHEQPAELPEISTAGLNEQVERSAELRDLVADVQRLPEQQRTALVLSELGDLSHAEVAAVIGREPQAVKGLVFRARAALAERRDARAADCSGIRVELAAATGGGLRRGRLRYHLESCPGCVAYLQEVKRQRKLLGLALPVVPTLALKDSVMGSAGIGAGTAGAAGVAGSSGLGAATAGAGVVGGATAGGAATAGGVLFGGTAVKLAVAGAILAGGAGVVATDVVREGGDSPPAKAPSAVREDAAGQVGVQNGSPAAGPLVGGIPAAHALEVRRGARGAERRTLGQQRAEQRSGGRSMAGDPPGKARGGGRGKPDGLGKGHAVGGGPQNAVGKGGSQAAPEAVGPQSGVGRGTGGAQRGGSGQRGDTPPTAPRQEATPVEPAPERIAPPAAGKGGGAANRPAFQQSEDAVPSGDR